MKPFNPDYFTIVDVGALGGEAKKWQKYPHNVVLFEPNPDAVFLENDRCLVIRVALSDSKTKKTLYVTRRNSKSSFLKPNVSLLSIFPNPTRFDVIKTEEVPADTLDNQLQLHNVSDIDFIKIDVQGHELSVLKGAVESLKKAVAVEVEVEFIPIYENQPLFSEVDAFLKSQGFNLVTFLNLEIWPSKNGKCLAWGDALYCKDVAYMTDKKMSLLNKIMPMLMYTPKYRLTKIRKKIIGTVKTYIKKMIAKTSLLAKIFLV